jgi:dihydroceramide fatty acyl 2-hydroxylase
MVENQQQPRIDLDKPILGQLHTLQDHTSNNNNNNNRWVYSAWIDRPSRIQPEFFSHPVAEQLTKVTWWVVPLIWLPVAGMCLWKSVWDLGLEAFYLMALGMVLWQFIEYILHRFLFHWNPQSLMGVYIHFLFHGCHHKFPRDVQRLVFPPFPAAFIAAGIFSLLTVVCQTVPQSLATFSGVVLGYVVYDCCHYGIHSGWLKNRLSTHHMRHHHLDDAKNFGISSPLFDYILGTLH